MGRHRDGCEWAVLKVGAQEREVCGAELRELEQSGCDARQDVPQAVAQARRVGLLLVTRAEAVFLARGEVAQQLQQPNLLNYQRLSRENLQLLLHVRQD